MPPPEKKGFRFQLWMLGALIVPVGIGIAVRDALKADTLELGDECSDSKHCKSKLCLMGSSSVCTMSCSTLSPCQKGFSCEKVKVTLENQAGSHDLGTQGYCMRAAPTSSSSSAPASNEPASPATPGTPPAAATSAAEPSATPKPATTAKPAPSTKKKR